MRPGHVRMPRRPAMRRHLASSSSRRFRFHDMLRSLLSKIDRLGVVPRLPNHKEDNPKWRRSLHIASGERFRVPQRLCHRPHGSMFLRGPPPRVAQTPCPPSSLVPHARPERNREGIIDAQLCDARIALEIELTISYKQWFPPEDSMNLMALSCTQTFRIP